MGGTKYPRESRGLIVPERGLQTVEIMMLMTVERLI